MNPRQPGGGRARLSRWRTHRPAVPLRVACVCVCVSLFPLHSSVLEAVLLARTPASSPSPCCVCVCVCVCVSSCVFPFVGQEQPGGGGTKVVPGVREHFTKFRTGSRNNRFAIIVRFVSSACAVSLERAPASRSFACWMCQCFLPCHPQHEDLLSHIVTKLSHSTNPQGH